MDIIVVEDDVDIAELVAFNLERQGWRCRLGLPGQEPCGLVGREGKTTRASKYPQRLLGNPGDWTGPGGVPSGRGLGCCMSLRCCQSPHAEEPSRAPLLHGEESAPREKGISGVPSSHSDSAPSSVKGDGKVFLRADSVRTE